MKRDQRQRAGICGALPFRRCAAPERDVDMSRAQHDALDMESHEITAGREVAHLGRWVYKSGRRAVE